MIRELYTKVRDALLALWKECRTPEFVAVLLVTTLLVTRYYLGSRKGAEQLSGLWEWAAGVVPVLRYPIWQKQVIAFVLQLLVPVLVIWTVHRKRLRDFGLGLGEVRFWLPITAVIFLVQVVVVAVWLSKDAAYVQRYPSFHLARHGGEMFWMWEASRLFYMLSWEFLFRGYLLFALEKRLGMLAVAVQTVPFVLMHIVSGKPISEIYFTIVSGVLSGLFVLVCRSVWPIVWLHAIGAILLDIFIVYG